jgi:saccharopine dehydrogenase-like NADP-dependent oxidoreductase
MPKVLVVGGTGFFGNMLVDDLLRQDNCQLVVASRRPFHSDRFETVVADLWNSTSLERALDRVTIAICAAGPYQSLPLTLVELCLKRGVHYIDLADDRGFVRKVRSLAVTHNASVVCTGWSTVPALSGLLVRIASRGIEPIDSIQIHMAPGNRGPRQIGTITSLLHSVGKPFTVLRDGAWRDVVGWSDPREFKFPLPVGKRRGYLIDVPDHEIFPEVFGVRTAEFRAGSELRSLNRCVSLLRILNLNWVQWSTVLQRASAMLSWMGHDSGAIGVEVKGTATRRASILADFRGQRIAIMPSSIMVRSILSGDQHRGLVSYADWFTEDQLRRECDDRGFRLIVETM